MYTISVLRLAPPPPYLIVTPHINRFLYIEKEVYVTINNNSCLTTVHLIESQGEYNLPINTRFAVTLAGDLITSGVVRSFEIAIAGFAAFSRTDVVVTILITNGHL